LADVEISSMDVSTTEICVITARVVLVRSRTNVRERGALYDGLPKKEPTVTRVGWTDHVINTQVLDRCLTFSGARHAGPPLRAVQVASVHPALVAQQRRGDVALAV
jgi:hypothetical protein